MANILLVDDDDIFSDIVIDSLMDAGHIVGHCSNGLDALAALKIRPPHLIILDCNMPEMSGMELLRKIRTDQTLFRIPVLMLTARTSPSDERIARFDGAQDYLTKPINLEDLHSRVRDLASRPVNNTSLKDSVGQSKTTLGSGPRMAI